MHLQPENWDIDLAPGAPQQDNGYDCGVFTILAMKRVCENQAYGSLSYDQSCVTALERALCTLECAYGTLHSRIIS
jgi:Ulp1 family protease